MHRLLVLVLALSFSSLLGCTSDAPEISRDDAREMAGSGKADHADLCEVLGWYEDDICDEFCPRPDPICMSDCMADSDCPQILCVRAPCPSTVCVSNACVIDNAEDRCDAGQRECQTCGENFTCAPHEVSCPLVTCPAPDERCDMGERACQTCGDNYVCAPDGVSCPLVTCDPDARCGEGEQECETCNGNFLCSPSEVSCPLVTCPPADRCDSGERECQTCNDNYVCAPDEVSCPLVRCAPPGEVCTDDCRYALDGECDDGGADSDYSLCALGTDCGDCGPR